jgi:hypothetical protein
VAGRVDGGLTGSGWIRNGLGGVGLLAMVGGGVGFRAGTVGWRRERFIEVRKRSIVGR